MNSVMELLRRFKNPQTKALFEEFAAEAPDSYAVKTYRLLASSFEAEKMWGSILQFATESIKLFDMEETKNLVTNKNKLKIRDLGKKKMAVFVNISDTDRSMDNLVNVFYTQALQVLCKEADKNANGRLEVPVRFILDDFAANVYIPNFEKIISVIRAREISVSLILQSISQLETLYTPAQAKTIINNCDHLLYLGGQDVDTAQYIGQKANKPTNKILNMQLNEVFLFTRGEEPRHVEKITPYEDIRCDAKAALPKRKEGDANYPSLM
jgi:type IV secretion system protein VirD4